MEKLEIIRDIQKERRLQVEYEQGMARLNWFEGFTYGFWVCAIIVAIIIRFGF